MWIGLFPELAEVGGIQQVSRHMGAVLVESAKERNVPCRLLGLSDPSGAGSFRVGDREYSFRGFGRNKAAVLFHLLLLMPQIETLYLGHVNLAPLGLTLRLIHPRTKYWVVAHGVEVWMPLSTVRRTALHRAERVVSVSSYTAKQMAETQDLREEAISVLAPALDPGFWKATGEQSPGSAPELIHVPPGSRILLTVGRLVSAEPGKGVDSVIRVLPDVLKAVPNAFYIVAGGGDLQGRLQELAREGSARDRIRFVGKLKPEQLRDYYSRCDIFVMPSVQEGFGIAFLEAMAFGKPVVAADRGGAPEVVQQGVTGFLVEPGDRGGLTKRLIELLCNDALRRKMGEVGRQRVEQNFTFERFAERLKRMLDAPS